MTFLSTGSNPLINGNLQGDSKYFGLGIIFLLVGLFIAVLIPYFVTPKISENLKLASGEVISFAQDTDSDGGDSYAEIYSFTTTGGKTYQGQEGIWSSNPAYKLQEKIEVYYNPENPQENFIKDDRNLKVMVIILFGIGGYFALFGLITLFLKFRNIPNYLIDRYMGVAGALSYGIPATLAWPTLIYFHDHAPNFFFSERTAELPADTFWIGLIFTSTGLLTIFGTLALLRAVQGTTSNSVSISSQF